MLLALFSIALSLLVDETVSLVVLCYLLLAFAFVIAATPLGIALYVGIRFGALD